MNEFAIKPAERKATPSLICLWGPSGSGKTFSALKLARGLVGSEGKIGLIDTENKRAEFYADIGKPWNHLDMQPPFTPQRYIEALRAFEEAGGYGCIIVDSMSHIWEGEGGVLDMADSATSSNGKALRGLAKWNAPKMAYKRALNYLLRAPFHVIFCLRSKEGIRQKPGAGDDAIEHVGLEPICEKNFIYEMTVSVLLGGDHRPVHHSTDRFKCNPAIPSVKAPDDVWAAIKPGEYLSEETGQAIAEWVNGGAVFDAELENLRRVAKDVATLGVAALEKHWKSLNGKQQRMIKPNVEELKKIAREADAEAAGEKTPENEPDPFSDKFTKDAA
jgi:hypothetical protein